MDFLYWKLHFDGSSTRAGGGIGIVLTRPDWEVIPMSNKLEFAVTNNEAEYEALIACLLAAKALEVRNLILMEDSKLIVKQTSGEYGLKEIKLLSYRSIVQKLVQKFDSIKYEHTPRSDNRHADALSNLGSKVSSDKCPAKISIEVKTAPSLIRNLCEDEFIEAGDWRKPIMRALDEGTSKESWVSTKGLCIHYSLLYYKGPGGILMRCITEEEGRALLEKIHQNSCGENEVSIYRKAQRYGIHWPQRSSYAAILQGNCEKCALLKDSLEIAAIDEEVDWRKPLIDYLQDEILPSDRKEAEKLKRKSSRYVLKENLLWRKVKV